MEIKNYYKALSLEEAYEVLLESEKNIVIGGGAWLKLTNKMVETAIDISAINLNHVIEKENHYEIGAMTTLKDVEESTVLLNHCSGILNSAISQIMGVSIRNIATIGGSIMGKYSFSDIITPLLVMDTSLVFYKQGIISLESFVNTKKIPKDILVKVIIKKENISGFFKKVAKTSLDFAVVNVAVSKGDSYKIRVGARPGLTKEPSNAIAFINDKKEITTDIIEKTANIACEEISFGSNSRASDTYRQDLAFVYIKRGISEVNKNES